MHKLRHRAGPLAILVDPHLYRPVFGRRFGRGAGLLQLLEGTFRRSEKGREEESRPLGQTELGPSEGAGGQEPSPG